MSESPFFMLWCTLAHCSHRSSPSTAPATSGAVHRIYQAPLCFMAMCRATFQAMKTCAAEPCTTWPVSVVRGCRASKYVGVLASTCDAAESRGDRGIRHEWMNRVYHQVASARCRFEAVGIQLSGYGMGIATQARGQAVRSCTSVVLQHSLAAWASLHASIIGNGRR